jgi:hypothetical protein
MIEDPRKPGIFVAPLVTPRSSPQREVKDRYSLVPQFRLEPDSARPASYTYAQLEQRVAILEQMINGASISAVCNMDGTITVTLVWG